MRWPQFGAQKPRGVRCRKRPQPPMTDCTVLVCADALAMAAPLAGAAETPDDASMPTPAATMTAARITRIAILLYVTEPFDRAHHKQEPAADAPARIA